MDNYKLQEEIIKKIQKEAIEPAPSWKFKIRDFFLWISGVVALAIGGLAIAVMIFSLVNGQWTMREYTNESFASFFFTTLPYVWIVSLVVFLVASHYNLRHTKKGYRYSMMSMVAFNIALSFVVGLAFYNFGFGHIVDELVARSIPSYRTMQERQDDMLHKPLAGVLTGIVIKQASGSINTFTLLDANKIEWKVVNKDPRILDDSMRFKNGNRLIVIGSKSGNTDFDACHIRPLNLKGKHARLANEYSTPKIHERSFQRLRSIECGPQTGQ